MRVRKKALRQLLQQKTLLGTLQSSNTTAKVLRSPKSKLFFHSISRKVLFRSAQNSLKGSDSATGLSYTVNKYVPVRTKTLINVRLLDAKSKASIKNRFYTRVYLRRRLRASLLLRRRLRLKRLSNLR